TARPGDDCDAAREIGDGRHHAALKCPKEIRFVASLPKSPIGEIVRKELRTTRRPRSPTTSPNPFTIRNVPWESLSGSANATTEKLTRRAKPLDDRSAARYRSGITSWPR